MVSVLKQSARIKLSIPDLLTFNGGYVDTAGFLALQGLFTAHVTGNFVTLGASLVHGSSGALAKLLALPVFCLVVLLVRLFRDDLARITTTALTGLLGAKTLLLGAAAALALLEGPFTDGDSLTALVTGLTLVAAMAIQNAVHRVHFSKVPPTTLMTGTTTQMMMDLADLLRSRLPPELRAAARSRATTLGRSVAIFALGCGIAALTYAKTGEAVFLLPPLLSGLTLVLRLRSEDACS